ncbi:hypothetical protein Pmar_PMAR002306, partial [Perkinsus marinus ATCC 50983]
VEMIKQVPSVNRVRYRLVPSRIKEDDFWQRYFYAILLIYREETSWDDWNHIDSSAPRKDLNPGPRSDDHAETDRHP